MSKINIDRMVRSVIHQTKFASCVISKQDLYQVGYMAGHVASQTNDSFAYIYTCISNSIQREAGRFIGPFTIDARTTKQAALVYDRFCDGESFEEIAQDLSKKEQTVRDWYFLYSTK